MKHWIGGIFIALWGSAIVVGLWLYGQDQITDFDPNGRLYSSASQPNFDQNVVDSLYKLGVTKASIVHLESQQHCYCNELSEIHQSELVQELSGAGYNLVKVNIENDPVLTAALSTFPALAIIDENDQLRYLGPYATGYGCFTGDDDLTKFVGRLALQESVLGAVVNSDAEGCYCLLSSL